MNPTPSQPECNGKNRYTHKEAMRAKKYVGKRRDKDMRIYECDICYGWHITKRNHGKQYDGM